MSLKGILSHIKVENLDVRYIIRGIIDGSLSSLGVVIGASGGDISIIIAAGVGGGVANGMSNILGALTAERAILEGERASQEKVLLQNEGSLKKSSFYQMAIDKTAVSGMQDGLATALGSIIPVMPFLFLEKKHGYNGINCNYFGHIICPWCIHWKNLQGKFKNIWIKDGTWWCNGCHNIFCH